MVPEKISRTKLSNSATVIFSSTNSNLLPIIIATSPDSRMKKSLNPLRPQLASKNRDHSMSSSITWEKARDGGSRPFSKLG
jgi:hypothetical protein